MWSSRVFGTPLTGADFRIGGDPSPAPYRDSTAEPGENRAVAFEGYARLHSASDIRRPPSGPTQPSGM